MTEAAGATQPVCQDSLTLFQVKLLTTSNLFFRDAVGMLKLYSQANNSVDQSTDSSQGTGGSRKSRTSSEEAAEK